MNAKAYLGPPIDVWAAGVSLYCFMFGRVPFAATSVKELADKVQNEPLVIPKETDPGLRDLITKLLEKDPDKRITISGIKVHPWVTRNGEHPMKADPLEVWVTDQEIANAIRTTTESVANVVVCYFRTLFILKSFFR
jgi:serine/threonine protein kinase